jgi:L-2-hydroxyglutarate oxidase
LHSDLTYDFIIIGAGIIGLATAREFLVKLRNVRVLVLEAEDQIGTHQTGHNSGVIHSGIYYQPDSLRSKNCLRGYSLMLDYLNEKQISHELCGKLIVAKEEKDLVPLNNLFENGRKVGLDKIEILTDVEASELQPGLKSLKSLWVPYTGIVSYKDVAGSLEKDVKGLGGKILLGQNVNSLKLDSNQDWTVTAGNNVYKCNYLISCAGLQADRLIPDQNLINKFRIIPFKGDYYALKKESFKKINCLLYPVPDPEFPFLGIHFTRHIDGTISLGPSATLSLNRSDYKHRSINLSDLNAIINFPGFWKFILRYWRTGLKEMILFVNKAKFAKEGCAFGIDVKKEDLSKIESGIRALVVDNQGYINDDFIISENINCLHLLNSPSPGATASLAIAESLFQRYLSGQTPDF